MKTSFIWIRHASTEGAPYCVTRECASRCYVNHYHRFYDCRHSYHLSEQRKLRNIRKTVTGENPTNNLPCCTISFSWSFRPSIENECNKKTIGTRRMRRPDGYLRERAKKENAARASRKINKVDDRVANRNTDSSK